MKNTTEKIVYVVLGIVLFTAFKPFNGHENVTTQDRIITVTGSADMLVPPDKISVDIAYREYWKTPKKKKASISEIESQIVAAANKAGVAKKDISINSAYAWRYNWNYWYYWWDYYNHLVEKNMTVQVKSSKQLNEMIQNLKSEKINRQAILNINLNGSSNEKIQDYRKMVKERAIQAAQEKADYMLKAVGEKRGRIVTITELDDPQTKTTTTHAGGYPYYHPLWGWYGGYGGHTTTVNNGGMNAISNSSVSMPSGGGGGIANGEDDVSMRPIKLRYEVEAKFQIVPR